MGEMSNGRCVSDLLTHKMFQLPAHQRSSIATTWCIGIANLAIYWFFYLTPEEVGHDHVRLKVGSGSQYNLKSYTF